LIVTKQVKESIKGAKIINYHSQFAASSSSSSTTPASAAALAYVAAPASAAPLKSLSHRKGNIPYMHFHKIDFAVIIDIVTFSAYRTINHPMKIRWRSTNITATLHF